MYGPIVKYIQIRSVPYTTKNSLCDLFLNVCNLNLIGSFTTFLPNT